MLMKRSPDEDVTGDVSLNRWWGGRTAEKKGVLRWTEGHTKVKLSCFAILLKAKGTRALARWVSVCPAGHHHVPRTWLEPASLLCPTLSAPGPVLVLQHEPTSAGCLTYHTCTTYTVLFQSTFQRACLPSFYLCLG